MNNINTIILVCIKSGCLCCDGVDEAVRSFTDKWEAEKFITEETARVYRYQGMVDAVCNLMAPWWAANPTPEYPSGYSYDDAEHVYAKYCHDTAAHTARREIEVARIEKLVGIQKERPWYYEHIGNGNDTFKLYTKEVPLGLPVEPARVDADRTAEPKTEIVGHIDGGEAESPR